MKTANIGGLQLKFENEIRTVYSHKDGFVELYLREKLTSSQRNEMVKWLVGNGWKHRAIVPLSYWKDDVVMVVFDSKIETMSHTEFDTKRHNGQFR